MMDMQQVGVALRPYCRAMPDYIAIPPEREPPSMHGRHLEAGFVADGELDWRSCGIQAPQFKADFTAQEARHERFDFRQPANRAE